MGSDIADSYLLAAIAFLAGIVVGWLLATVRARATMRDSAWSAGTDPAVGTRRPMTAKIRTMELKCACGALSKFRDPVEDGYLPFPSGDSVACPSCGRVLKLNEFRKLEKDARSQAI